MEALIYLPDSGTVSGQIRQQKKIRMDTRARYIYLKGVKLFDNQYVNDISGKHY